MKREGFPRTCARETRRPGGGGKTWGRDRPYAEKVPSTQGGGVPQPLHQPFPRVVRPMLEAHLSLAFTARDPSRTVPAIAAIVLSPTMLAMTCAPSG